MVDGTSAKAVGLSPKAAGAAPFKPKSTASISSLSQGRAKSAFAVKLKLTKSL